MNSIMKICAQTEEQRDHYRRTLRGDWVFKDYFFTTGGQSRDVSATTILSAEHGSNRIFEPARTLPDIDRGFNRYGVARRGLQLVQTYLVGVPKCIKPGINKLTFLKRVDDIQASQSAQIEFYEMDERALNQLDDYGNYCMAIVCAIIWRRKIGYFFPQLVRVIRRCIHSGAIDYSDLLSVAEKIQNRFAIATIKLAHRGFKSKRFKPRPLVVGENIRRYYDRWSMAEVMQKANLGKITRIDYDSIYLQNGDVFHYSDRADGHCEVWPIQR